MEDWKETLADTMTAWDYQKQKFGGLFDSYYKYYIVVKCPDKSARDLCSSTMAKHMDSLCTDFKQMVNYTDNAFKVQVGSSEAQNELHNNLNKIVTEVRADRVSAAEGLNEDTIHGIKRRNFMLIAFALIAISLIIYVLWK